MSLNITLDVKGASGFPRVSGDEPAARKAIGVPYVFSPRERG